MSLWWTIHLKMNLGLINVSFFLSFWNSFNNLHWLKIFIFIFFWFLNMLLGDVSKSVSLLSVLILWFLLQKIKSFQWRWCINILSVRNKPPVCLPLSTMCHFLHRVQCLVLHFQSLLDYISICLYVLECNESLKMW